MRFGRKVVGQDSSSGATGCFHDVVRDSKVVQDQRRVEPRHARTNDADLEVRRHIFLWDVRPLRELLWGDLFRSLGDDVAKRGDLVNLSCLDEAVDQCCEALSHQLAHEMRPGVRLRWFRRHGAMVDSNLL